MTLRVHQMVVLMMVRQGFLGALEQYWDVQPKPRLNRKNTWFKDNLELEPVQLNIILYICVTVTLLFMVGLCLSAWIGGLML